MLPVLFPCLLGGLGVRPAPPPTRLRGGAFVQDNTRGFCEETGAWLDSFDLPHEDAHNLTVVFPRDTPHPIVLGARVRAR
jgi:hypothetical protein